ncbi:MAG: hypothetical protein ABSG88_18075 [Bradyrhizobium sp.]
MKRLLLAAALSSAFVTGAIAQSYDPSPRDPPFGKGNPGNDTYRLPYQTDLWGPIGSWGSGGANNSDTSNGTRIRRTPGTRTP